MRTDSLASLSHEPARAVIINVGTELLATLALASAVRHAGMPIVVVNASPTDASSAYFESLMEELPFDLVDAPFRRHGDALDSIFGEINAELVLLLDSDAELLDPGFVNRLRSYLEFPHVFGAGFINGPKWLADERGETLKTLFWHERPWLPCVLLRTSHVREALADGASFATRMIYNDLAPFPRLSALLAMRFQTAYSPSSRLVQRLPNAARERLRRARLPWLAWARREFYGHRPNYVWCDTGTDVYQTLRYGRGLVFAGLNASLLLGEVAHYEGVTRASLKGSTSTTKGRNLSDISREAARRLSEVYGITAISQGGLNDRSYDQKPSARPSV